MARVLIVEPEPDLRMLTQEALTELGHQPVVADERPVSTQVDVVLAAAELDVGELAALLEAQPCRPALVLVGATPPRANALALDPVEYLHRPFRLSQLDHALAGAMTSRPVHSSEIHRSDEDDSPADQ